MDDLNELNHFDSTLNLDNLNKYSSISNDKTEFKFKEDDFNSKFFKSLNKFRINESFCDIKIKIQNKFINCHKIVIASTIPFFTTMLNCDNMLENQNNIVEINDEIASFSTFEKIIEYAYSGEIILNTNNIQEICLASSFLCINTLLNASIQFIINNLDHSNVLEYKSFSKYFPILENHIENFINEEFINIYKTPEFLALSFDEIMKIVSNDELNIDEEKTVYEAIIAWIKSDEENRKIHLYSLLEQIKLPYISPEYMVDNILSENLIKKCLKCRDIIDEAKDWHLLPQRRFLIKNHRIIKRNFTKKEKPIIAIGTEGSKMDEKITYFKVYNPNQDEWEIIFTDTKQLKSRTSIAILNDCIYFIGGYERGIRTNNVEVYSLTEKKWTQIASLNEKRSALASVSIDNKIFALGGFDGTKTCSSCEYYSPKVNRWSFISDMNNNRCSSSAVVCNGFIFLLGGHDGSTIFRTIERYNLHTDKWDIIGSMSKERCRLGATSLGSKIYIAGGFNGITDENTFEYYDTHDNTLVMLSPMLKARSRFSLISNARKIYAIGGCDKKVSVEVYDIDKNEWTMINPMNSSDSPTACLISPLVFNFNN